MRATGCHLGLLAEKYVYYNDLWLYDFMQAEFSIKAGLLLNPY